ncbi:MAG: flagellar hook-associated protein FlgK [Rhodospirillales bacterium]|nr:flagellar hook-associated protein FlgK [Rhodospirillales bacterium]
MSLVNSLNSAVSSLQAAQAQLQVTSSNIANVNTEGYSRKTVSATSVVLDGQGAGVSLSDIKRTVDENLLRQIREHIATLAGKQIQNDYLTRTQNLFGTLADNSSLSHGITDLGSALEALATSPESAVARSDVVDTAWRLAEQLNRTTDQLQQMRAEVDREIGRVVGEITSLLSDIDAFNTQIVDAVAIGRSAAELQDQRDGLINDLAELIDIQYFERPSGEIVIATTSGRTLLDSVAVTLSHTPAAQLAASATYQNGISGIGYGAAATDITTEIRDGRLAGLIALRDETLVDLQAEIDRLAETLRDQLNALHNDGTAFPPPTSLTGTRGLAATDAPAMTGTFRVTVVDSDGVVVETQDIDLTALAPPNIGQLVAQINGMANATASINASGQVVIGATGGNSIAVNELDSQVTSGTASYGMAQFLGLNDFLDSGTDYDVMLSDRTASDTAALGLAGTLSFSIAGATTNVAYVVGDSLTDVATAINGALGGSNITASVIREGSGYRLEIVDADGDNFFLSDSGTLAGQLNLRPGVAGTAGRLEVRGALVSDPNLLVRGELSDAAGLAVGDIAISTGDGTIARAMATAFTADLSFAAAGGLPTTVTDLAGYAANILALNASNANAMDGDVNAGKSFRLALETQAAAISQVNLDEELASLVIIQNAYAASARLTTTISEMLDILLEIV